MARVTGHCLFGPCHNSRPRPWLCLFIKHFLFLGNWGIDLITKSFSFSGLLRVIIYHNYIHSRVRIRGAGYASAHLHDFVGQLKY